MWCLVDHWPSHLLESCSHNLDKEGLDLGCLRPLYRYYLIFLSSWEWREEKFSQFDFVNTSKLFERIEFQIMDYKITYGNTKLAGRKCQSVCCLQHWCFPNFNVHIDRLRILWKQSLIQKFWGTAQDSPSPQSLISVITMAAHILITYFVPMKLSLIFKRILWSYYYSNFSHNETKLGTKSVTWQEFQESHRIWMQTHFFWLNLFLFALQPAKKLKIMGHAVYILRLVW